MSDILIDVRSHGAVGDGVTDDTAAIQAAVDEAATSDGGAVAFVKGTYSVEGSISIASGVTVAGHDAIILAPDGTTVRVFDLDGVSRVHVHGLRFVVANGDPATGNAYAIDIRGASTDIVIERCEMTGFVSGVRSAGGAGSVAGTCRRITIRSSVCKDSPSNWGFGVDDTDGILFDDCHASGNWLDGFKLRKLTKNATILGGSGRGNGLGFLSDPVNLAGDGIDAYAGGDTFLISGFVAEANYGNGITIKTGQLNDEQEGDFGNVRSAQLVGLRCIGNLAGSGLYLAISDPLDSEARLVNGTVVTGGIFEANSLTGIYVNARNVTLHGVFARGNGQHGITTAARAMDVAIMAPVAVANGTQNPGTSDGVNVSGTRIRVVGGVYVGKDANNVATDADFASLTAIQARPVHITSAASNTHCSAIVACSEHAVSNHVVIAATSGTHITHGHGPILPPSAGVFGSVGSTWARSDAGSPEDAYWVKGSGAPNASATGWKRVVELRDVVTRGDQDTALGSGSWRTVIYNVPLSAARNVDLPTALLYAGMRFRVVRTANATGASGLNIRVAGPSTIKTLAPGEWAEAEYSGSAWFITAFGTGV